MTIKVLKLVTGEEVMGDIDVANASLAVTNAVNIIAQPDPSGKMRVGMAPFAAFTADKVVHIYPHAIIADYEPALDILNEYNRVFGSGIQIATAADMPR
jgi:hypothetical protein